jgi:hypothetical protein
MMRIPGYEVFMPQIIESRRIIFFSGLRSTCISDDEYVVMIYSQLCDMQLLYVL